jgi:hypothetical protein
MLEKDEAATLHKHHITHTEHPPRPTNTPPHTTTNTPTTTDTCDTGYMCAQSSSSRYMCVPAGQVCVAV